MIDLDRLDFAKGGGLVTVIAQDARSGAMLMVAHADREALEKTIATGEMHYRSRTRGLWRKGDTSGNTQRVVELTPDCDGDAVLARVIPAGPACHTGQVSCFGDPALGVDAFARLERTIVERMASVDPPGAARPSHTRRLIADRNLRLKKIGEEAAELILALADADAGRIAEEAADLFYHALVATRSAGVGMADVREALDRRAGSGAAG